MVRPRAIDSMSLQLGREVGRALRKDEFARDILRGKIFKCPLAEKLSQLQGRRSKRNS